eukprot:Phypoly_transcript_05983.p1 GENE.Phypoly_transcript_05983~~Phypoly_transcript_05983.p1  ORF type:complete len:557 (+),score=123.39 Phypoly_transcript_05983:35-1705(+)
MAAAAVSPPPVLSPEVGGPPLDNLQELLRRKREIEKNKSKYHLTEADCSLILTNANEYSFTDGQVILEEGQANSSVYRIKSGTVSLSKNGKVFCELSQGWFIGETLFLDNKTQDVIEASLIAKGPVTLREVNLPFVKKLFEVDKLLALKFYRNLASKLSSIFYAISGNLMSPCLAKMYQEAADKAKEASSTLTASVSTSSVSSNSSSSSSSSNTSSSSLPSNSSSSSLTSSPGSTRRSSDAGVMSPAVIKCSNVPQASVEVANRRRRMSKRRSISIAHAAFKVYILETDGKGVRTCRLKKKKIKIISEAFGFKHKTTINFSKIKNVVKTSPNSITIIFDPLKAKTLFFKTTTELEEFYGITHSLIENVSKTNLKASPGTPLSHASTQPSPLKNSIDNYFLPLDAQDDPEQRALDKEVICSIATRLELKRGDILMEEGDLFQRIYTITKGSCETVKGDHVISTIREGEVFGEASLLHLRPAPVTIRISSETASVLVIPAYKLHELINANPALAVRIYKKTAALVDKKIDRVLRQRHQLTTELCGAEFAKNVPERLNL